MDPSVQDCGPRRDVASKGEIYAHLVKLGARVHVPGMIDVCCTLVVCLRDVHGKNKSILYKRHDVDLGVNDVLHLRDQISLEHTGRRELGCVWALGSQRGFA